MGKQKLDKKNLGLGVHALFNKVDQGIQSQEEEKEIVKELTHTIAMIPLDQIEVNPFQPRKDFDEQSLDELAESIKTHGLIQPITVRRLSPNEYQLISGERRFRASKIADLTEVPAYVRLANDQSMLEMALVENVQREDLNPLEIAFSLQRLKTECGLTDEQLADRVGKNRATITNYRRLLDLSPKVQAALKLGDITKGHAITIAGLEDHFEQDDALNAVKRSELSVRKTEVLVNRYKKPGQDKSNAPKALPPAYLDVKRNLGDYLESNVEMQLDKKSGHGKIVINFANLDHLNRILELIQK